MKSVSLIFYCDKYLQALFSQKCMSPKRTLFYQKVAFQLINHCIHVPVLQ